MTCWRSCDERVTPQEVMIPTPLDQLGNQHGDLPIRIVSLEFQDIVQDRAEHEAIWRRQCNQS
jgi:hypothetical protein